MKKTIFFLLMMFTLQAKGHDYKNKNEKGSIAEKCQSYSFKIADEEVKKKGIIFDQYIHTVKDGVERKELYDYGFDFYSGLRAACAFGDVYAQSIDSREQGLSYTLSSYLSIVYDSSSNYLTKSDVIDLLSRSYYFGYSESKGEKQ